MKTHLDRDRGTPPAEVVPIRDVVANYVETPWSLVVPSVKDGIMTVLAPLDCTRRPLRCTSDASSRCWRDHMSWFGELPKDAATARAKLDLIEARLAAVRAAEVKGLRWCVRARYIGMLGFFAGQLAVMCTVAGLVACGHDAAADLVAVLIPLPYVGLLASAVVASTAAAPR